MVEKLHGTIPEEDEKKNCDPVLDMDYDAMSPLIHKIVMMVRVEYGGHISLKSIADKFRMNSTYLGQIFIKETGMKFFRISDVLQAVCGKGTDSEFG